MLCYVSYSCGCGENNEVVSASFLEVAEEYAYQRAIEEYEFHEGFHGIKSFADILEEEFNVSVEDEEAEDYYDQAQEIYDEEVENAISYSVEEYDEEKHGWLLEEQGMAYEI